MPERRHLLLVLENGIAEVAKVRYAVELARRMDCVVSVLMLVPYDGGNAQKTGPQQAFNHAVALLENQNLSGFHDIRYGDKASEFIKYIAVAPTLAAIIWGSDGDIVTGRRRKKSEHWFEKVRPHIHIPIVTPRTRAKGGARSPAPRHKSTK